MDQPKIALYVDAKSQRHYVRVTWPGDRNRLRMSLGVPADQDPAEALRLFKQTVLPQLIVERAQRNAEEAEAGKPAHTRAGYALRDLADWYCDVHLKFHRRAAKTEDHYRRTIYDFLAYASTRHIARTQQLSPRIFQEWQIHATDAKGRTGPSRDQMLAIRLWWTTCAECGEFPNLPELTWSVPGKTKSKRFKAYDRAVIQPWLDGLKAWRPKVWLICAWVDATGWRISDVLDLRVGEIDRKRRVIDREQLKTGAGLPWPLLPRLEELLTAALSARTDPKATDHVFVNHKGAPWGYQQLVKVLAHYHDSERWNGPAITFRDLRKSFGTRLAMQGCPPNVLKELLGHQDVALTMRYYVDVDLDRMREWGEKQELESDSSGQYTKKGES